MATSTKATEKKLNSTYTEGYERPTWQVELIQQAVRLKREVQDMQTFRDSHGFTQQSAHVQRGLDSQLEATRNLLHVVNERISYFI